MKSIISRTDHIFIIIFAIVVALPGYFFVSVNDDGQSVDSVFRFIVILVILTLLLFRLLLIRRIAIPKLIVPIFIFVIFGLIVSIIKNPYIAYTPTGVRWFIYGTIVVLFYNIKESVYLLNKYFILTFVIYALSALVDLLTGRSMNINSAMRVVGSVGSAPGLASAIYVTAVGCIFFNYNKLARTILIAFLAFVTILLTKTRFILIVFVVFVLIYLLTVSRTRRKSIGMFIVVTIFILAAFYIFRLSDLSHRFIFNSNELQSDSSTIFRLLILDTVWSQFRFVDIFTGLGLGDFSLWFEKMTGFVGVGPHFEILWLFTETGIVGMLLYFVGYYIFLVKSYQRCVNNFDKRLFFLTFVLIVSMQTSLQFSNPTYFYQVMIPIFMTIGAFLNYTKKSQVNTISG
ncbi:hypothetical protein GURASL_23650 [Geotalea uraniireducens]|uniref:O-antigen ligase-related domain-containing protein n=1 Tax=Geotalea uraniireducens TaxID=351604 RepID=A0ABM8ELX8_9BACT|nr:O-antigen ligase family protein [Geotalea uraniireducens]BDV43442.1 hypothetical protein GURASL_23650 [Geotalea uraniireducens]